MTPGGAVQDRAARTQYPDQAEQLVVLVVLLQVLVLLQLVDEPSMTSLASE